MTNTLYHYTCNHGSLLITDEIRPNAHPWLPRPVIWLTDRETPDVDALGLTSHILDCNRTEYRYEIPWDPSMIWWPTYAKYALTPTIRMRFESPGTDPASWWVTEHPIDLVLHAQ